MKKYKSWDEYFDVLPSRGKEMLIEIKEIFETYLPEAKESWGYGVPAYDLIPNAKLDKKIMLGGYKHHIAIYPGTDTLQEFKSELEEYEVLNGTLRFKYKQSVPKDLVRRMILYKYNKIINEE